ncbi:MAG TPA: Uma2 family endonuclease [Rhizobiaceae bacterium]|nr:Uma2 family endonuclease [Rhizobiaceae bacterium]
MGAKPKAKLTVSQFVEWCDKQAGDARYELVDGEIVAMGLDRIDHNRAKTRAASALNAAFRAAGKDCEAFVDGVGVTFGDRNFRIPDVVAQCGPVDPAEAFLDKPVIVIEIVSASSMERDAHAKLHEYFSIATIEHYLIVYLDRQHVVHHWRGEAGNAILTRFWSDGEIDLSPPGARLPVAALLGEDR